LVEAVNMSGESKIGIFYGSSTGNTENIAELIKQNLNEVSVDIHDVSKTSVQVVHSYKYLIFGVSTWGVGDIQDDFEAFLDDLPNEVLQTKKIALFGLGDQHTYSDCFADALGKVFEILKQRDITIVGHWNKDGYNFNASRACVNDKFVGLVIDEDTQEELTTDRVKAWVIQLKHEFNIN
jgi:flavodoxin I